MSSTELDIIPVPQLNPESGRIEKGWKVKGGGAGDMDGAVAFTLVGLALTVGIVIALVWLAKRGIGLGKRLIASLRARAEAKRLTTAHAALTATLESLDLSDIDAMDEATRAVIAFDARLHAAPLDVQRHVAAQTHALPPIVDYPVHADAATREQCEAEAIYDRLRGIR